MAGEREGLSSSIAREVIAPTSYRTGIGGRRLIWFVLLVAIAHAITYFLVGALAFATITHGLYEGTDPLFGGPSPRPAGPWRHWPSSCPTPRSA